MSGMAGLSHGHVTEVRFVSSCSATLANFVLAGHKKTGQHILGTAPQAPQYFCQNGCLCFERNISWICSFQELFQKHFKEGRFL